LSVSHYALAAHQPALDDAAVFFRRRLAEQP